MSRIVLILRGLPGSGKSTYAKTLAEKRMWKRVNKDDLRRMIDGGVYSAENEDIVRRTQDDLITKFLRHGYNVVVDNTNLPSKTVHDLHRLAEGIGDIIVLERVFDVGVAECLKRNAGRVGAERVPDEAIHRMAKYWPIRKNARVYFPGLVAPSPRQQNPDDDWAIICDIDGTFSLIGDRSPYDASKSDETDAPHWPVVNCLHAMYEEGYRIIFVSAREAKDEAATRRLIEKWYRHKNAYQLFMRATGDHRKDSIVKREIFEREIAGKYFVDFVLDDRPQVVRMWRYELGLSVFAVNDKEF